MASSSTGRPFSFEDGPYGVPHTDVPVAERDLVPGLDGEPHDGTADVSASDESPSRHIRRNRCDSGPCRQLAEK
jgi:hypothetical protein